MKLNFKFEVTLDPNSRESLDRTATALEWIEFWQRPRLAAPEQVVFLRREQISMEKFQDFVGFKPPKNPGDVRNRQLKVAVHGTETIQTYGQTVGESNPIGPLFVDDDVTLQLRDLDAAGNASEWSQSLTYTVIDNVAPATPEAPFMIRREQLDMEPPPPEPPHDAPTEVATPVVAPVVPPAPVDEPPVLAALDDTTLPA